MSSSKNGLDTITNPLVQAEVGLAERLRDVETFKKMCELSIFLVAFYIVIEIFDIPQGCRTNWVNDNDVSCRQFPYPERFDFMACSVVRHGCFAYMRNYHAAKDTFGKMEQSKAKDVSWSQHHEFCSCMTQIRDGVGAECGLLSFHISAIVSAFLSFVFILSSNSKTQITLTYFVYSVLTFGATFLPNCSSRDFQEHSAIVYVMLGATAGTLLVIYIMSKVARFLTPKLGRSSAVSKSAETSLPT
jgi:hypothetical protein